MSTVPFPVPPVARPPVISRRAMLTVSAAAGLSSLAAGYVSVTRPLLRPTGEINRGIALVDAADLPNPGNELAVRFLPGEPWAAEAKYVVRNGRSVLFFDEWRRMPDGRSVELKPFAMVFPPKPDEAGAVDEPLTVAGKAAVVQLEGEITDITTSEPGRIVAGQMPGRVELRGPDGLNLLGSDFYFDEKALRIWSDQEVAFCQGSHSGRGRGVTLDLFRVGAAEAFESVAVSGIRSVRLLHDVEMDLRLGGGGGGPFASLSGEPKAAPAEPEVEPLPTRVSCTGEFTFDLRTNQVTFDEAVVAARATEGGGPPDSLECDKMTVVFEPNSPEGKQAHAERWAKIDAGLLTEEDGFQATDGELAVVRLLASGRNAILRSPSNELVAQLSNLTYEAATGTTSLSRTEGLVQVNQGTSVLASPTIVIEPTEEGGTPRIGCVGRGWMKHEDAPGKTALTARWSKGLQRLRAAGGLDLVRLSGDVQVVQPEQSFQLVGDEVELWLDPSENAADAPSGPPRPTAALAGGRMEPKTLVAVGNVKLASPELRADANRLDVTFVSPSAPVAVTGLKSRAGLTPASGRILLASAEVPEILPAERRTPSAGRPAPVPGDSQATSATETAPAKVPEPIELIAETIAVLVERSDEETASESPTAGRGGQLREVHTTGGVKVVQKRGEGEQPLYIEGDRLDLFSPAEGQELVHIHGTTETVAGAPPNEKPARVHDQGSDLWGMQINLDRGKNVAWVDGKGVLQLPVKDAEGLLNSPGEKPEKAAEASEEPAKPQRLDVWWQDSMRFDGDKAVFLGTVQTQLNGNVMTCEEMEVRLTERFDFAAVDQRQSGVEPARPEVSEVLCKHQVLVYGKEFEAGKHAGDRRAAFHEFRLDQRTGDTHAVGPGEIMMWRKGDGNRAGLTADNAVRANSTARREGENWEYLRVDFDGTSDGNIRRRTTTFNGGVEVVYGPVADIGRTIDPNHPERAPAEAGWMTSERLTLTQHAKTDTSPAYSEVDAEGNVKLDGRGFAGEADQVTFDESKGQYILRSFGKRFATIAKTSSVDGNGQGEFAGREMQFYPARNFVKITKAKGGDGIQ